MTKKFVIDFRKVKTPNDLPLHIGIESNLFFAVINQSKSNEDLSELSYSPEELYPEISGGLKRINLFGLVMIPKKNKSKIQYLKALKSQNSDWKEVYKLHLQAEENQQYRKAFQVKNPDLADSYKAFARRFELFIRDVNKDFPHEAAYGYVRGRNILENAKKHCGALFLLRADIKNFFPSISDDRLAKSFITLGICEEVAKALAAFLTLDGQLPLGLHASPMLANLVCLDLDKKLTNLANQYGCRYTRYADDITFSGLNVPSKMEISGILKEEDFELSETKFRITKIGQAHYVTGLSVSDNLTPHVPRSIKRNLRQELYFCKKYGIINHLHKKGREDDMQRGINRIDGMVRYVSHIEHSSMPTLHLDWKSLLIKNRFKPSYSPRDGLSKVSKIYVDETIIESGKKKFLALAFMITEEADYIESLISLTLNRHLSDPFSTSNPRKKILEKEKLHYNAANEDLKTTFISLMTDFSFKSYLIYGEIKSDTDYSELYFSLVKKMLPHRLIKCDGQTVKLFFE